MQVSCESLGLVLPANVEFYFATNTGNAYAKYNRRNGDVIFVPVDGEQFAADLATANVETCKAVTSADINDIIANVYKEAVKVNAGRVTIKAPSCIAEAKSKNKKSA